MTSGKKLPYIILGIAAAALIFGISVYNSLIVKSTSVDGAWANVETQYQRRFDLIPNLVSTVKGAANFEQETLTAVTDARTKVGQTNIDINDAESLAAYQAAQGELTGALTRLLAVSEAYPELKAVEAFRDLQVQLEGTENRITTARKDFNAVVADYNASVMTFPRNTVARLFGFGSKAMFQADQGAAEAVKVDFAEL